MKDLNQDGRVDWHDAYRASLSAGEGIADAVTKASGTWTFLFVHCIWWSWWLGALAFAGLTQHFDPPQYNLLTMVLSLEAILLSTLVLMSQNRSAKRDKIAQEQRDALQTAMEHLIQENTSLTKEIHAWTQPKGRKR